MTDWRRETDWKQGARAELVALIEEQQARLAEFHWRESPLQERLRRRRDENMADPAARLVRPSPPLGSVRLGPHLRGRGGVVDRMSSAVVKAGY